MSSGLAASDVSLDVDTEIWGWFLVIGAVLTLLGIAAFFNLVLATVAATFGLGAGMFIGAILQIIHGFRLRRRSRATFWISSGLLYLLASAAVLYDPLFAVGVATLVVVVGLATAGIFRVIIALDARWRGRGWMAVSGIISFAASFVIALGWPSNAVWVLGLILAVDLIGQGMLIILVGFALRMVRTADMRITVSSAALEKKGF